MKKIAKNLIRGFRSNSTCANTQTYFEIDCLLKSKVCITLWNQAGILRSNLTSNIVGK